MDPRMEEKARAWLTLHGVVLKPGDDISEIASVELAKVFSHAASLASVHVLDAKLAKEQEEVLYAAAEAIRANPFRNRN